MLIYHFGSKAGLIVAVIRTVEEAQRRAFDELDPDSLPVADAMRAMWRRFTSPELGPHERLFFEIYGQALQGRPGAVDLLDGIIESWVDPMAEHLIERGEAPETARVDARLTVAVMRGLLLDWLATGDRAGVDAAFERYVASRHRSWLTSRCAPGGPTRPRRSPSSPCGRRPTGATTRAFLDACRDELTVRPEHFEQGRVVVGTVDDTVAGFSLLLGGPPQGELEMLFVEPAHIGTGVGAALLARLRADARDLGCTVVRVEADPHAIGFYEHHGAVRVGDELSATFPGRTLPILELDLTRE